MSYRDMPDPAWIWGPPEPDCGDCQCEDCLPPGVVIASGCACVVDTNNDAHVVEQGEIYCMKHGIEEYNKGVLS